MLQDNIWFADHEFMLQDWLRFREIDVVDLMMIERRLEATKAFEDSQELSVGVAMLDLRILPLEY